MKSWIKSVPLLLLLLFVFPASGYTYTGTIRENGDDRWDSNEYEFIRFTVEAYQTFEVSISSQPGALLEVFFCDCSSFGDIDDILLYMVDYETYPSELYFWIDTVYYPTVSFTPERTISGRIAIFTYDSTNPPSMQYTLTTNIEASSGSNTTIIIVLVVAALIIGVFLYQRSRRSSEPYSPYQGSYSSSYSQNYQPPSQPPSYTAPQSNSFQQSNMVYCSNCGKPGNTRFCQECGSPLEDTPAK